jgi:hypothetical protein
MASLSIHNIKSVHVSGQSHDTFCTLKLNVCTQHKSDKAPIYENIELYFDSDDLRQAFIETIAFQYDGN